MGKKNYLTVEEQKVWEYIRGKEIVDNELVRTVFPDINSNKRNKILHSLYQKGYLMRARKDLYYNQQELKSYYDLALRIRGGYVGLSSALRYYNLTEYEDFTIFIMTKDYQKRIALKGTQYEIRFVPLRSLFTGFEKKGDIYVSSIEKTLFDCFLKPGFIGFTNITKALYDAKPDWNEFIRFFKMAKNASLCQRTGYILELMAGETNLSVPSSVLDFLQKHARHPVKLAAMAGKSAFNRKWKIQDNLGEKNILSWRY